MIMRDITDPNDLTAMFSGLLKGTRYRAKVAGNNIRGKGEYSEFFTNRTDVDGESIIVVCVCVCECNIIEVLVYVCTPATCACMHAFREKYIN